MCVNKECIFCRGYLLIQPGGVVLNLIGCCLSHSRHVAVIHSDTFLNQPLVLNAFTVLCSSCTQTDNIFSFHNTLSWWVKPIEVRLVDDNQRSLRRHCLKLCISNDKLDWDSFVELGHLGVFGLVLLFQKLTGEADDNLINLVSLCLQNHCTNDCNNDRFALAGCYLP